MADALAMLASMIVVKYWNEVPNLSVMRLDRPTHVFSIEEVKDEWEMNQPGLIPYRDYEEDFNFLNKG